MHPFYSGGFLYNPKTNSVLLHKRDMKTEANPGKWANFGGLSEGDETPKQTFTREMKEELGVNIAEEEITPLCDYFNEERQAHRYIFFVRSNIDKSEMHLTEGADFDWIPLDKVFEYDLTEKTVGDMRLFSRILAGERA